MRRACTSVIGLTGTPTLSVRVHAAQAGRYQVKLSYLATGIDWTADYVARIHADGATLDLTGMATLANFSATSFADADVQLVGGMVLHRGRISEMATGEGKTLVATLPLYLNALTGKGAHLVTVNDYLARRDAEWMGQLYTFLGLTCGCIQHDEPPDTRREQYAMDITYGTNSEFGFDYLRDNGMATTREQQVQRGYNYAIVDEVDSILIDEARTPLIISGPSTVSTHQYDKWKPLVDQLVRKQNMLCNRLASEAKELFEQGKMEEGGLVLFKVKLGQPSNKPFLRMMEEPRYQGLLFGEISALTQWRRLDVLETLLDRPELHARLVDGSDYPLPGVNSAVWTWPWIPARSWRSWVRRGVASRRS